MNENDAVAGCVAMFLLQNLCRNQHFLHVPLEFMSISRQILILTVVLQIPTKAATTPKLAGYVEKH